MRSNKSKAKFSGTNRSPHRTANWGMRLAIAPMVRSGTCEAAGECTVAKCVGLAVGGCA